MDALKLSKDVLYLNLGVMILALLVIFAFIFVGVSAFSIPGTFGSIVNSAFPMGNINFNCNLNKKKLAGGAGLDKTQ